MTRLYPAAFKHGFQSSQIGLLAVNQQNMGFVYRFNNAEVLRYSLPSLQHTLRYSHGAATALHSGILAASGAAIHSGPVPELPNRTRLSHNSFLTDNATPKRNT